jgi:hypothetical protein
MDKNIEDLTTPEIMTLLADFDEKYVADPQVLLDEEAYPTDDLVDLLTLIYYLEHSGELPEARSHYGQTYKELENEIARRLGEVPYTDLT